MTNDNYCILFFFFTIFAKYEQNTRRNDIINQNECLWRKPSTETRVSIINI